MWVQSTPISKVRKCHVCINHPMLMLKTLYCGYIRNLKRSTQAVRKTVSVSDELGLTDQLWPSIKEQWYFPWGPKNNDQTSGNQIESRWTRHSSTFTFMDYFNILLLELSYSTALLLLCDQVRTMGSTNQWQSPHNSAPSPVEKFVSLH